MCYRRKTTCRELVVRPLVWEWGIPTRGLTGRPLDLVTEALDTMGFFKCPRLRQGLVWEYRFLPWSLHWEWCGITPCDEVYRDVQGLLWGIILVQCPCLTYLLIVAARQTLSMRWVRVRDLVKFGFIPSFCIFYYFSTSASFSILLISH